jgi:hypothetical protein
VLAASSTWLLERSIKMPNRMTALRQLQDGIAQLSKHIGHRAKAPSVQALETQLPSVGPQTALT